MKKNKNIKIKLCTAVLCQKEVIVIVYSEKNKNMKKIYI